MNTLYYQKIVLIIVITLPLIFIGGCAPLNMFKTVDLKTNELQYAYKYRDTNAGRISLGMSKEEVVKMWGRPSHVYNVEPTEQNDYNHYSDEIWIYSQNTISGISYEIYFKENKIIVITENEWNERFIGLQDL